MIDRKESSFEQLAFWEKLRESEKTIIEQDSRMENFSKGNVLFKNGKIVNKSIGFVTKGKIKKMIE